MALQITTNINVDFYDKKYLLINAKQYDDASRWIAITCYNQGSIYNLSANKHSAYIKYRKADGYGVLNSCKINNRGEVLVELTEQMLAADGICYVDLVVINKGSAMVNVETGEIIAIDNTPILSTMAFCVNVYETSVDNSEIESSYEYNALNNLLQKAEADYSEVIMLSKSYAVGDAGEIRDGENTDNSKYYCEQSLINANNASVSEENAATSETNAKTSETNAANSESNAKTSETNAANSASAAATSETNAATSETNAKESEEKANEYYELVKSVVDGLNGGFIPIGTITFEELATVEKNTGFTYNISNDFVTTVDFAEGAGKVYTAGTNVYCRSDGLWDCFGGSASPTATVDEVKSYLGI